MWLLLPPTLSFQRPFIPHDRKTDFCIPCLIALVKSDLSIVAAIGKFGMKCDKSICKTPSYISVMVLDFQEKTLKAPTGVAAYDNFCRTAHLIPTQQFQE
jgi:hypothetical protein